MNADRVTEVEQITELIDRVFGLASRLQAELTAAVNELGVTEQQARLVWVLDPARRAPQMRDLAGVFHCDPSSVTSLVGRMERRGLVERRPSVEDQRVREVQLTAAGRRVRRRLARVANPSLFGRLTVNQRGQLLTLLSKVDDNVEALDK